MRLQIPQATVRPNSQILLRQGPRSSTAPPSIDELVHQTFQALIAQVPDIYTYRIQHFCNPSLAAPRPSSKAFLGELASSQEHQAQKAPRYAPILPPAVTSSLPCGSNL